MEKTTKIIDIVPCLDLSHDFEELGIIVDVDL